MPDFLLRVFDGSVNRELAFLTAKDVSVPVPKTEKAVEVFNLFFHISKFLFCFFYVPDVKVTAADGVRLDYLILFQKFVEEVCPYREAVAVP